jgi:hypothetical protein
VDGARLFLCSDGCAGIQRFRGEDVYDERVVVEGRYILEDGVMFLCVLELIEKLAKGVKW